MTWKCVICAHLPLLNVDQSTLTGCQNHSRNPRAKGGSHCSFSKIPQLQMILPWYKKPVIHIVIHISLKTNLRPSSSHFSTNCYKLVNNFTWSNLPFQFTARQFASSLFLERMRPFPCVILLVSGTMYKVVFIFICPYFYHVITFTSFTLMQNHRYIIFIL